MGVQIECLAQMLREACYAVALTGAGVSTESGIPDFRSPGSGLWMEYDSMEVASIVGFRSNPARFYRFWHWRFGELANAVPNVTHYVLAELEARGLLQAVITQNIDNLHRQAGSRKVLEVHGNFTGGLCIACKRSYTIEEIVAKIELQHIPLCDDCSNLLKPDVVLFGEPLSPIFEQSLEEIEHCDLLLVLGSSLEVYPIAQLVPQTKSLGAKVAVINRERAAFDGIADLVIHSELHPIMTQLHCLLASQCF